MSVAKILARRSSVPTKQIIFPLSDLSQVDLNKLTLYLSYLVLFSLYKMISFEKCISILVECGFCRAIALASVPSNERSKSNWMYMIKLTSVAVGHGAC